MAAPMPPEIDRIVCVRVEERRLEERGGHDHLVERRIVVGVDGLRRDQPLRAVPAITTNPPHPVVVVELLRPLHVAEEIVGRMAPRLW